MMSCINDNKQSQEEQMEPADIEQVTDSLQEVTGVAIDGAMNSVYLKVGDDTIEFSYPDLDSEHRASWSINDTLTVRYYETADGDSVTFSDFRGGTPIIAEAFTAVEVQARADESDAMAAIDAVGDRIALYLTPNDYRRIDSLLA